MKGEIITDEKRPLLEQSALWERCSHTSGLSARLLVLELWNGWGMVWHGMVRYGMGMGMGMVCAVLHRDTSLCQTLRAAPWPQEVSIQAV